MPNSKGGATDSQNPNPKRQRLPKFRSAHSTREPEPNKSWVMTLKHSEDNRLGLRADTKQRMHRSVSATPGPSSSVGDTEDFVLDSQTRMEDTLPNSAKTDTVSTSRKRKRDNTTCVRVIIAFLYYMVTKQIPPSRNLLNG